ncbi:putative DNA polymerase sliding clamp 1 [Tetrabaena socialis]|uniref:DNA sliding clamp PCNA n=2 Tax=Tetrabaena socialis TaxID=47790 RepID=A0A2J7ZKX0_9CHLO|nr:putative DNA polymerase sliding clamp 1 [Tetrabaena socialis]PNH01353.1 putative DNA polymerase sliding clamp 1 [Tetrabaena socialis]|eukprot:PNH00916.1 putative DNA polymerase sliding clamp 1 [Tetrabaena socialis]
MSSNSNYCVEIRTVQSVSFKILVEALKELLTDTCIEMDSDGIRVVAMDTSHVVLVHLKLEADKFESYHCPNKIVIGVNMLNMHKLIKTINNNDTLSLFIEEDNMNHLGVKIENGTARTQFKLNLLDLDNTKITVPPAQFTTTITMPSCEFQKICRDMNNLAEYMEVKNIQNTLIFSCKGDFCCQETILCDNDNGMHRISNTGDQSEIVQGVFSIKHLVLFTKCTNLCNTCEIFLKNDYPLIIRYSVASLGEIKLCLAPQTTTAKHDD